MIRTKFSRMLPVIGMCCSTPVIMNNSTWMDDFQTACKSIEYISLPEEEGKKLQAILMRSGGLTDATVQELKKIAKATLGTIPDTMFLEEVAKEAIDKAQVALMIKEFQSVCRSITPTSNRREVGEKLQKLLVEHGELTNDTVKTLTSIAEATFTSPDLISFKTVTLDAIINARVELNRKAKAQ